MSRIRRIAPRLSRGGLIGNTEGPESYLRELDTLPSQFCRATGGTETVISQGGKYYRVHTFTDTDPTSLLLNFDGSNGSTTFTDDSGFGHAVTANGGAAISTTQSKFGGSSAYFDGTGDYLESPISSTYEFGTGDFTVELFVRFSASAGLNRLVGIGRGAFGSAPQVYTGWSLLYNSGSLVFYRFSGAQVSRSVSWTPSLDTWYHIAVSRSASSLRFFVDGIQQGSTISDTTSFNRINDEALEIGQMLSGVGPTYSYFNGYIDSLRVTKGQALYTAAFTPPTQALTRVGSGSLTFTRGGAVEYLVVGGGGGGASYAGGGGAGGYVEGSSVISPGLHAVVVGAGGDGGGGSGASADFDIGAGDGSDSEVFSFTALGGGKGGKNSAFTPTAGGDGGSGGGGGRGSLAGGSGLQPTETPGIGYGNDGATYTLNNTQGGAGGGAGGAPTGTRSEIGGVGKSSSISGSSTYYAGGGGGSGVPGDTAGAGGLGGGGDGGATSSTVRNAGEDGEANTGGGGGAGNLKSASPVEGAFGGDGGSGIVIARYRITQAEYEAEAA